MLASDGIDAGKPPPVLCVSVVCDGRRLADPAAALTTANAAAADADRRPSLQLLLSRLHFRGGRTSRRRLGWCLVAAQLTLTPLAAALHAALTPAALTVTTPTGIGVAYAVLAGLVCAATVAEAAAAAWLGWRARSRRVAEQLLLDAATPAAAILEASLAALKLAAATLPPPLLRASAAAALAAAVARLVARLLHLAGLFGVFHDCVDTARSAAAATALPGAAERRKCVRAVAGGLASACRLVLLLLLIVLNLALLV